MGQRGHLSEDTPDTLLFSVFQNLMPDLPRWAQLRLLTVLEDFKIWYGDLFCLFITRVKEKHNIKSKWVKYLMIMLISLAKTNGKEPRLI